MLIWRYEVLQRGYQDEEPAAPGIDWRPDLDVYEDSDGFLLLFAVPGVRQEDVEILATGTTVTIGGGRSLPVPANATTHRIEVPRGRFERSVRLPAGADPSGAQTQLKDGLLLVRVPKKGAVPVQVQVQVRGER